MYNYLVRYMGNVNSKKTVDKMPLSITTSTTKNNANSSKTIIKTDDKESSYKKIIRRELSTEQTVMYCFEDNSKLLIDFKKQTICEINSNDSKGKEIMLSSVDLKGQMLELLQEATERNKYYNMPIGKNNKIYQTGEKKIKIIKNDKENVKHI